MVQSREIYNLLRTREGTPKQVKVAFKVPASLRFTIVPMIVIVLSIHLNVLSMQIANAQVAAERPGHELTSNRLVRSATIQLNSSVEKVFPLFGALRERDWAAGWNPEIIFSESGEMEEHMIFKTPATFSDADSYLWMVSKYEPTNYRVEYMVSTAQRIWFITVQCRPSGEGTAATVTYGYTGLTEKGNNLNKVAIEKMFANDLKDWEEAINFYLLTGKKIE